MRIPDECSNNSQHDSVDHEDLILCHSFHFVVWGGLLTRSTNFMKPSVKHEFRFKPSLARMWWLI